MELPNTLNHLRGPFGFLRRDPEEIRRLMPALIASLPAPQPIDGPDESAPPLFFGFPILVAERLQSLRQALREYLLQEEMLQLAIIRREPSNRKTYNRTWDAYLLSLGKAIENVTLSAPGSPFPALFWLHHSLDVASLLKETPRRVTRLDTELGRLHGDSVKYRVYDRYIDRVLSATYDLIHKLAKHVEQAEEMLFPRVLNPMFDNVLIFTEDYISPSLDELGPYFNGYLRIDGRMLKQRLRAVTAWHRDLVQRPGALRDAVVHLVHGDPDEPDDLLKRSGYLSFLATRDDYNPETLLDLPMIQVWEKLLARLKEFEFLHALRRLMLPVEREGDNLTCRATSLNRTMVGRSALRLAGHTRPIDFMAPWVVDPRVLRFGMVYDITDFSQVVSTLHRSGTEAQDESFRNVVQFQRRINRMAASRRMKLEKYLGDGAFYSSREARPTVVAAIHVQRFYSQVLEDGFPFNRGLRIGLNFGRYRLVPIDTGRTDDERYEFFGKGVVELSRLTTGKAHREIDEIKTLLVNQGYREDTVRRFFDPLIRRNVDTVDRQQEVRQFYAYINASGVLVNEGIVASQDFLDQLDLEAELRDLWRVRVGPFTYVGVDLDDAGTPMGVGFRKLGTVQFKGLEQMAVFEVVDLARGGERLEPMHGPGLVAAVERNFRRGLDEGSEQDPNATMYRRMPGEPTS